MKKTTQFFKALSDDTRLRILALLSTGELCVCDLMAVLDLPQSTVSRHLAYLRNSGLVEDRRQGVWMFYRLAQQEEVFRHEFMDLFLAHLSGSLQAEKDAAALHHYLESKEKVSCG